MQALSGLAVIGLCVVSLSYGVGELAGCICSAGYLFLAIQCCMLEQACSLATALVFSYQMDT